MRDKRRDVRVVLDRPELLDERAVPAVFVPPSIPGHTNPALLTNIRSPILHGVYVPPSVPGQASSAPLKNVQSPVFHAASSPATPVPAARGPMAARFGPRFG